MDPAYITFGMGDHEYTATVYAIEDLERSSLTQPRRHPIALWPCWVKEKTIITVVKFTGGGHKSQLH